jgi:hypothetical protein
MNEFKTITKSIHRFISRYYLSELITGFILFFSLGFLYLFFTLFLEYFLWLSSTVRAFLVFLFFGVEVFLLVRFVAFPIFKLIGFRKGISTEDAAKIIGMHFPKVTDKLLNVLQLEKSNVQTDLVLASIYQKSKELQRIPFGKAVDFKKTLKYLKFAIVPILIWLVVLLSGNNKAFIASFNRVVNYNIAFIPPAPFYFSLESESLQVVQGESLYILLQAVGKELPKEVKIIFGKQSYYLQNIGNGKFSYTFHDVQKATSFFIRSSTVQSSVYNITVINTPAFNNISLKLKYAYYLDKKEETIQNAGNITVPEGTGITWSVATTRAEEVVFIEEKKRKSFKKNKDGYYGFFKKPINSMSYQIAVSNANLKEYETLQFSIAVVKDEFPKIAVQADTIFSKPVFADFVVQVSDDYGLEKLQVVYYKANNPADIITQVLPISKATIQSVFYQFPNEALLDRGVEYALFFEVYDNDGINGSKKAISDVFRYRQKTEEEMEDQLLKEQRGTIKDLELAFDKQQIQQEKFTKIQQELERKNSVNWDDKNKVEDYIKRQQKSKQMLQKQTDKLQSSLGEVEPKNNLLKNRKEVLKQRIEELKKTDKQNKLLAEIAELAKKLNKDGLVQKAKELAQQNKQQERSLERILELVKRFYIEQKTMQIANKLQILSKDQELIEKKGDTSLVDQEEIRKRFEEVKEQLEEVTKDNEKLKEPLDLPDVSEEEELITKELLVIEEKLKKKDRNKAKKGQKKSADKMQQMSSKLQSAMMEMEAESTEENMEDLRKILENLITFSFKQEVLMNKFGLISTTHPDFGKDIRGQDAIRTYFEHIDDSLYVLSMRLPKISLKIQEDVSVAHYNLEQSLENFSENRFNNGIANQRYVMTSANSLADYLSNLLNSMKNAAMKLGKGEGKSGGFSLPDIIKKQGELSDKMKEGSKKGEKGGEKKGEGAQGKKPGSSEASGKNGKSGNQKKSGGSSTQGMGENGDLNGALYEIYKEQSRLRQQLQEAISAASNGKLEGNSDVKNVLKTMEQLEKDILMFGFNNETIQKMQQLNYELLKLEKAALEQGEEQKRKSNTSKNKVQRNKIKALNFKSRFSNQIEILNRQSLPLQQNYKLKVREYFSESNKRE